MLNQSGFGRKDIRAVYVYGLSESKTLAHLAKDGDNAGLDRCAQLLARITPRNATLIPIPNHSGRAEYTLALCNRVAEIKKCKVADILVGRERDTLWQMKMDGKSINSIDLGIRLKQGAVVPMNAYLVDNIYDTGKTYNSCVKACGVRRLLTIAVTHKNIAEVLIKQNNQLL